MFAPGPSLPGLWHGRSSRHPKICINDSWARLAPRRTGRDRARRGHRVFERHAWFDARKGLPGFDGVKVCCIGLKGPPQAPDIICLKTSPYGSTGYDERLGYICPGMNSGSRCSACGCPARRSGDRADRLRLPWARIISGAIRSDIQGRRPDLDFRTASEAFVLLAKEIWARGEEIVNCTPGSALPQKWFPQVPLDAVLERRAA